MKKPGKKKINDNNVLAYEKAQQLLKERQEGLVRYDKILTGDEQISDVFPEIVNGDILFMLGNEFYWKRQPEHPLILYAKHSEREILKEKGLVEICRMVVPEIWTGFGLFRIDWPVGKRKEDSKTILISLYLCSTDRTTFEDVVSIEKTIGAYLATLFLDEKNADQFNQLMKERFQSVL